MPRAGSAYPSRDSVCGAAERIAESIAADTL